MKKGDFVKCFINDLVEEYITIDHVYEIKEVNDDNDMIYIISDNGELCKFSSHRFYKIEY